MQTKCNTCCRQSSSSVTAQSFPCIVCIVKSIVRNVCRLRVEKHFVNAFNLKEGRLVEMQAVNRLAVIIVGVLQHHHHKWGIFWKTVVQSVMYHNRFFLTQNQNHWMICRATSWLFYGLCWFSVCHLSVGQGQVLCVLTETTWNLVFKV